MDEQTKSAFRLAQAIRESKRLREEGLYLLDYAHELCALRGRSSVLWNAEWIEARANYLRMIEKI